jgi:hypothetical protein
MAGPQSDYVIPFGVDPRRFFEGLNKMDEGVDTLAANITQTGKEMQKAFDGAASSGDVLGKRLDLDAQKALGLRDQAKAMGKEIGGALSGKDVGAGLEERLSKVRKLMEGSGGTAPKLAFNIDDAQLEQFEQRLISGENELKVLADVADFARAKLATLDPNSQEFQELAQQVSVADEFLKNLGETTDQVNNKNKSLKGQLREMKAELAAMEMAGKDNTQEFLQMSIAAGKLEDQIGDVSARVRVLASDTKYIDAGLQAVTGLAGAFAAAQGAAALFGSENEAVNEAIKKVTAAMAILQGVQAIAQALNKDSALSVLLFSRAQTAATVSTEAQTVAVVAEAGATVAATTATRSFTAALLANPITLVVVAIVAAVAAFAAFAGGSNDAEEATDKLNDALERQNQLLKLDEGGINRRTNLLVAQAKAEGKSESEITTIVGRSLADRINLRKAALDETNALLAADYKDQKLSSEGLAKLEQQKIDQTEEIANLTNDLEVKRIERDSQRQKEQEEIEKKGAEASKKNLEEQKKAAELRRQIAEQELKFRQEFNQAYIDSILDPYDKEREQLKNSINQKISELEREKSLSEKAEQEKNDAILILRQNLSTGLKEIDSKRDKEHAALLFAGQQKMADLEAEGAQKELDVLRLSYKQREADIKEQFKNEGALKEQLLKALREQQARDEKKITDQAAQTSLKDQEERAVLEVETAAKFLGNLPAIEKQKQIAILKVKLDYAEKSRDLLISQGNAEDSTAVLQAKKSVQELQKALGIATKEAEDDANKFDLFKFLGLGDLTEEQKNAVIGAAKKSLESIQQITSFIVDQYQRQIDAKQKVIDQETDSINDLEDQLDKEKALREQGLANNVDTIQAELDEKKRQREEDLKQQEEMQKKQQAIQRVQLAIDTATQASGLITSAANIFKSLSSIPIIGVPLAIATIALMVGAFATAKVKAFQAISAGQKQTLATGGRIEDGKPHSKGGKKYVAIDGSGDVKELESGEHVTRRTQAEKYSDLLDAINEDRLDKMTEDSLRAMLGEMGIHFTEPNQREAVTIVRERDQLRTEIAVPANDIAGDVKNINRLFSDTVERERNQPKRWTEDGVTYIKKGNKTTRLR